MPGVRQTRQIAGERPARRRTTVERRLEVRGQAAEGRPRPRKDREARRGVGQLPGRRLRRHLWLSGILAASITIPLVVAAGPPNLLLALLLAGLFFLLNLNIVESALLELAGRRPSPPLPERAFPRGIPDGQRAVVVYPILLRTPKEIRFFEDKVRPSVEANDEPNARWVILSGSPDPWMVAWEKSRVRLLQRRYGTRRVLYVHRHPAIGNWEKKRGAYMHLMHWIVAGAPADGRVPRHPSFPAMPAGRAFDQVVGEPSTARGAENLLVGDSDTRWTPGSVRKLVSKIAEPANREYVIFQGRVAPDNPHGSVFSHLQRFLYDLFRARHGSDWKVYGRVNFTGHGAGWNVDRFLSGIAGRMADGYLSHDIVESYFLKTAFVSDVETTEEVQETVENIRRQWRRWWKGNRIASLRLLGPWMRDEAARRVRNRNFLGKLLLLHADRNYVLPLVLGAYLVVSGIVVWMEGVTFWFATIGGVYFGLVMLRFYLPLALEVRGANSARKIGFALVFLTALVHVLMVEKARIVLRDLRELAAERLGVPVEREWVVQSSLGTDRSFRGVLRRTWGYPVVSLLLFTVLAGVLGINTPLLTGLAAVVAIAPVVVWTAAQRPPEWLRSGPEAPVA